MSPIFGHGRLRLYLLKLLDESPRHGYDIIRILEDRFLGVYAPSAGTIYPRLARLEEEGLVTHEQEGGRKIFRLTEAGRAELHARMDELTDLEREIEHSVRDIAREVTEDVRKSVRGLREDLKHAARDVHEESGGRPHGDRRETPWENVWENAWQHARDAQKRAWRDSMRAGMREGMEAAWRSAWKEMQTAWDESPKTDGAHTSRETSEARRETEELEEALQSFTDAARDAANHGYVDDDAVRACRSILDNTLTTLRATLRTKPPAE